MKDLLVPIKGKQFKNLEKLWYCFEEAMWYNRELGEEGHQFQQSTHIGEDKITFYYISGTDVPKLVNIRYTLREGNGEWTLWLHEKEQI